MGWVVVVLALGAIGDEGETKTLGMSPPVACASISGYGDFEPLPGAALTSDEKLQVYYRPLGYRVERMGAFYVIHLTQDAQIRRKGDKQVLQRKEKIVEYEFKSKDVPSPVFMRNTISMKGLKPGEYSLDIILHDELGEDSVVKESLVFRIVPPGPRKDEGEEGKSKDHPTPP